MTEEQRLRKLLESHGFPCSEGIYNAVATALRELDKLTCRK